MARFDARGWVVWALALSIVAFLARNPVYSLILILVARVVFVLLVTETAVYPFSWVRIGAILLLFAMIFNAFSVHVGATVLFTLPSNWPWIGGVITLEAMVGGLANGLILLALLTIFITFNNVVATNDLVRLIPRAFRDVGIVILIAVTYVPETMQQVQRIREAQAIRGHRLRGVRDWQPVILPLLIGGLERAMGLAEAMVARGYGATAVARQSVWVQIGLLLGLVVIFTGWIVAIWQGWLGWLLLAVGGVGLLLLLRRLGQQIPTTRYRRHQWTRGDMIVVITAVLPVLVVVLPLPLIDPSSLNYTPYPQLAWPDFDIVLGLGLLLFLAPALMLSPKSPKCKKRSAK